MITIGQIDNAITRQLPRVALTPDMFGDDPQLSALLEQYFQKTAGRVVVDSVPRSGYSFDRTTNIIQFSGVGAGGPFDGMTIRQVTISVIGGTPRITIEAQAPAAWTLNRAFPDVKAPILRQLNFKRAELYWANFEDDDNVPGFYFSGILDFDNPPLSFLQLIVPHAADTELWGEIGMVGSTTPAVTQYVPDVFLTADTTEGSSRIGPFTLYDTSLSVFANPFFNTFSRAWQTNSMVRISTLVGFGATRIQLKVSINDVGNNLIFEATLNQSLKATLIDIVNFVGGTKLEVPGFPLQFPDALVLQTVKIGVNLTRGRILRFISVGVGSAPDEKWRLWGGVELENISIVFRLTPDADGYIVGGEISGEVNGWLGLYAAFASDGNYTFYGGLIKPLPIKDVYAFFAGNPLDDLPDLSVSTLEFCLNRLSGQTDVSYSGNAIVDGSWPVVTAPIEVSLDGLLFRIEHEAGAGTQIEAAGVLGVGDYSVGVRGLYDSADGWTLEGRVSADPKPPTLSEVSANIEESFPVDEGNAPAIPPFLTGWYLEELAARFATKKKDFDLTLEIGNTALPWLDLHFGVHLRHGERAFTRTFDAQATIAAAKFDMDFQVEIEEAITEGPPPSKTFILSAAYQSINPPHLSDLLMWLSGVAHADVNLPAELGIDATPDGFALQVRQKDRNPPVMEVAGAFSIGVAGSDWNLYFAFTNSTSLSPEGPPVMVDGQVAYVFGVALSGPIDLSKLPLAGTVRGVSELRIDKLGFFYTNAPLSPGQQLYFHVPAIGDPGRLAPDPVEASLTRSGFSLMAIFRSETGSAHGMTATGSMRIPVDTGRAAPAQQSAFATEQSVPQDPVRWLDVNKTFGPVNLQKIGLSYGTASDPATQLGAASLVLDGTFQIAGFTMALDRLGVGFNVPKPSAGMSFNPVRDIQFRLGGLFVEYNAPDFRISGGFITLPGPGVSFIGEFTIMAGMYGLQAYGGFSDQQGSPSLFIFLHLEAPLGGPPFFFVNGLAGGFGVNRAFKLPTFAELGNYPFLPASKVIPVPSQLGGDPQTQLAVMTQSLVTLARYVPVQEGEYWLAVGIDVTSFQMIQVTAVLSVQFGVSFQVGLVGAATMTLPVNEPRPIAFIQIDFELTFSPANGLLAALGKITPASFLYATLVHLSGGFAFYTWFSGPDSGQYVMTVGGYNPRYQRPPIYPDVPRLRMTFELDSLRAEGEAYFALVPHAMMAGFAIHATWSQGPIDAWFDAGLDFLLNWKPFHYEAQGYISIGVSVSIDVLFGTIHVTVHTAVDLKVWGPPFGGRAIIDLDVISFAIDFGSPPTMEEVDWTGFRQFLPSVDGDPTTAPRTPSAEAVNDDANKPLVNIAVTQGLLKAFKPGENTDGLDWLIDPNGFQLTTESVAPCSDAAFNAVASLRTLPESRYLDPADLRQSVADAIDREDHAPYFVSKSGSDGVRWTTLRFGIPPLGRHNVQSVHTVGIQAVDDRGNPGPDVSNLIAIIETRNFSQALWGNATGTAHMLEPGNELIRDALSGFRIEPMLWFPKRTTFIPYQYLVFDTNDLLVQQELLPAINTAVFPDPVAIYAAANSGAAFSRTAATRGAVIDVLRQVGFANLELAGDSSLNTGQYAGDFLLAYMSGASETHFEIGAGR